MAGLSFIFLFIALIPWVILIVLLVWFVRTLNEMKHSLLRIEMKLMGYNPMTGEAEAGAGVGAPPQGGPEIGGEK